MSRTVPAPTTGQPRRLTKRGVNAREKILDATIRCIVRAGFTGTTVEHVMAEAQLSRGSVLYQFPNRVTLMAATAELAMRRVMDAARKLAEEHKDPFERLSDYARISWEAHSLPEGLALTDILLAARWDRELLEALQPITSDVEQEIQEEFIRLAREAGFADPEAMVPHGWLLVASVRGLIIEHSINQSRPMIAGAIEGLNERHRRFCAGLASREDAGA